MNSTQRNRAKQIIEHSAGELQPKQVWDALEDGGLPDWVATRLRNPSPPGYELQPGRIHVPSPIRRHEILKESGLSRIDLSVSDGVAPIERTLAALTGAAFSIDGRTPVAEERPESDFVVTVLRSRIPDHDLPVLGPGGRFTAFAFGDGLQIDFTMRKRTRVLSASWRSGDEIVRRIRQKVADAADGMPIRSLRGAYGFFELSKYESQMLMRPVFVVVAEIHSEADRDLGSSVVVEPATHVADLPSDAGLGVWGV